MIFLEILFWSIHKLFNTLKEYFFSAPQLPNEIMSSISEEAHNMMWQLHRVGNEPHPTEYYDFYRHIYEQRYDAFLKGSKTYE